MNLFDQIPLTPHATVTQSVADFMGMRPNAVTTIVPDPPTTDAKRETLKAALKAVRSASARPSTKILDAIYGPRAATLRASVASIVHGRPIAKSHPEAQYGRLRAALMDLAGIDGKCAATKDACLETTAAGIYYATPHPCRILDALHAGPQDLYQLADMLNCEIPDLCGELLDLELAKRVTRLPGNRYAIR